MNSCGKKRSPAWSAATHSSSTAFSMRRIASISGMQVSVTRFMWRLEQRLLIGGREIAVVRHALVVIVRHEVEDVLLEVGAGAADAVHLVLADHFGERKAELGGAHRAGEGDEHLAAVGEVIDVALGRVDQRGGVEMAVVVLDESRNRRHDSILTPQSEFPMNLGAEVPPRIFLPHARGSGRTPGRVHRSELLPVAYHKR